MTYNVFSGTLNPAHSLTLHSPHVIRRAVKWYASTDGHSFQQSGSTDNHGKWHAA